MPRSQKAHGRTADINGADCRETGRTKAKRGGTPGGYSEKVHRATRAAHEAGAGNKPDFETVHE